MRSIRYQIAEAIYCDSVVPFNPADHGLSTNMDVTVLAEQPIPPRVREMLADNMRNYAHRLRRMEDIVGAENVDYSRTVAARNSREIDFLVRYYGINPRDHRERAGLLDAARIPSEPVALAKLEELLQPIGIDVRSWSMSLHGGYGHEGGTSSDDRRDPMPGIFGREFARLFLTDEPRLEEIYNELSTEGSYQRVSNAQARVLQQEMCNIVRPKAEQERRRGRVLPNQPEGTDDAVDN
ncbi:MAG: hypothetical protein HRT44_04690 [Bdellovibrionales bacterium]|nr:hypothetical protein [Bdellovibrionales bacterium]NQZ18540.1 hypothetical protein [Bdellovibrionales bacterium]